MVDCRIVGNRILDMGASGITVAFWFDPEAQADGDRHRPPAHRCQRDPRLHAAGGRRHPAGAARDRGLRRHRAGLGAGITIQDNLIVEVGTTHPAPIVGIFVLDGEAVAIQRNHLRDNGRIADAQSGIGIGWAGGIIVTLARPGVDFFAPFGNRIAPGRTARRR